MSNSPRFVLRCAGCGKFRPKIRPTACRCGCIGCIREEKIIWPQPTFIGKPTIEWDIRYIKGFFK